MKNKGLMQIVFTIGIALFLAAPGFAQEEPGIEGEDTITVLGPDDRPEAVDKIIALPENASERAVESSQYGLETANQARERNRERTREFGLERAREAREGNMGEQVRDRATRPDRPDRPERPERPDIPEGPERPDRPEQPERPDRPELPEAGNPGGSEPFRNNR